MKQSRRWVALVAALMMAASLVATPRVGMGLPDKPIDSADPPQENFGEPDIPTAPQAALRLPTWWETFIWLERLAIVRVCPGCATKATSVAKSPCIERSRHDD
ncbi:MAG: hypothetical protein HZC42_00175 [Candidatus Eisenbacteria bacterium]|nr:hypothetical protein [Candidatus Eisenbacteria bacterium]